MASATTRGWGDSVQEDRCWAPSSFAERGVAVPFTTPMLAGARVRRGGRGLEAVVPQPAGLSGVHIAAWSALVDYGTPTMHDLRLAERIAEGGVVTPLSIRQAAGAVAREGLAGRAARRAAQEAISRLEENRRQMRVSLLERLVVQSGRRKNAGQLEDLARDRLCVLGARMGVGAADLLDDIAAMAAVLADHDLAPLPPSAEARLGRVLAGLQTMTTGLARLQTTADEELAAGAVSLEAACARMRGVTVAAMRMAAGRFDDMETLLRDWRAKRVQVLQVIALPDWLMDGWRPIVRLWHMARDNRERVACLPELALLVPPVPAGLPGDVGEKLQNLRARRMLAGRVARPSGPAYALVARNETLLAMAA